MTEIESPLEAEWDVFHEWVDAWAQKNSLSPSRAKALISNSIPMLKSLKEASEKLNGNDPVQEVARHKITELITKAEAK